MTMALMRFLRQHILWHWCASFVSTSYGIDALPGSAHPM